MFYVLRFLIQCAITFMVLIACIFAWQWFSIKVIHDGAWRGPLTCSRIYTEKWYRTEWGDGVITDPVMAIYSVLTSVVGALLSYDIPDNFNLRMDEFLSERLVAWINECGDQYGISKPTIVRGKYHIAVDGEWKSLGLEDYAMVTCVMDLDRYGMTGQTHEVRVVDFLYPYATLYPEITKDYKITRRFLRHIWNHMDKNEYTIMLNPSTDALEYWAKKAVGSV